MQRTGMTDRQLVTEALLHQSIADELFAELASRATEDSQHVDH